MNFPPRQHLPGPFSDTFARLLRSEQAGAILLAACTLLSLALANSPAAASYVAFWERPIGPMSLSLWINDALMAVFFLMIGLELERELYEGELSRRDTALLPLFAAAGGMIMPALIHLAFNAGSPAQGGFGIPMATDIAFAIGALAVLGSRIPPALKVFLVALAVADDLGAIVVIALFYGSGLNGAALLGAVLVWALLGALNRFLRIRALAPYLLGGGLVWFLLLKSGVHPTLAGVMLAFAIPFRAGPDTGPSPSQRLESALHRPVAFVILPLFALANTGIVIEPGALAALESANAIGIIAGLTLGKPAGIVLFSAIMVRLGWCRLPANVRWAHVLGAGMLGGIGFTMSIFIANLAFVADAKAIAISKLAILIASVVSFAAGFAWLRAIAKPVPPR